MPTTELLSDLEEQRKRDILEKLLATDPMLRQKQESEKILTAKAKHKSRMKLLKSELMQNPELQSIMKYTTLGMEEI